MSMTTTQRTIVLSDFLEARRALPFAWGSHDCCMMAEAWIEAIDGRPVTGQRGRYGDAAGALRITREIFGETSRPDLFGVERWMQETGLEEVPARLAQRGDVVSLLAPIDGEAEPLVALGICVGAEAAAAGSAGLRFVRMPAWRRAWRVGSGRAAV